ncbi:HdeD family acid-resistance protein [Halorussus halophilus]|uniref:HdeD family acid-resistance protein n=1 Tax=Halorussus halophilus TaxID=2650975 RepID=UPI001CE4100B|nr:DUF308 domain-containing protein [Halorussus halophilus]
MSETASVEMGTKQIRGAMIGGAIIAILGILAILFPFVTGLSLSILLGALLIVGALVHVAHAFSAGSFWNVVWQIVLGLVYGFAGISLMANPVLGLTTLTILAIAFLFVGGLAEIAWGIIGRGEHGAMWLVASGIISLLLAGLLWAGFPASAAWAVGVLFGVNLLVTGVSMVMQGRANRRAVERGTPTAERGQEM